MKIDYKTHGTCASAITIELEGEQVMSVCFAGGCHGNAQGVAALAAGLSVGDIIERLRGIECGAKGTSCPDQLATALTEALLQVAS
jgi:uncharacterized protein (TIGR03905 family)